MGQLSASAAPLVTPKSPARPPRKGLWRPKSLSNLLARSSGTTKSHQSQNESRAAVKPQPLRVEVSPSPASVPLPLSPTLPSPASTDLVSAARGDASGAPDTQRHVESPATSDDRAPSLQTSLAMLDTQLASLHKLASPRSSTLVQSPVTVGSSTFPSSPATATTTTIAESLDEQSGLAKAGTGRVMASIDPVQAEPHHKSDETENKGRELWDALGFDDEHTLQENTIRQAKGSDSADEQVDEDNLAHGSVSRSTSGDDIEISEFPSYSDLQAFAPEDHPRSNVTGNRSSNLLEFPLPPAEVTPIAEISTSPSTLVQGTSIDSDDQKVFTRLAQIAGQEQAKAESEEAIQGLGLFDASDSLPMSTTDPAARQSEDSLVGDADEIRSEQSSSYTQSSREHSVQVESSANTSFNASKEDVATYQAAIAVPHSFSGLPTTPPTMSIALADLPDEVQDSLKNSPPPAVRAVASLHNLPEILRTLPTPPSDSTATESIRQSLLASPLAAAPPPRPQDVPLPLSPSVVVAAMRPQSVVFRPVSTASRPVSTADQSTRPALTPSRKSSGSSVTEEDSRRSSRIRDSQCPTELYMRPTSELRLDGDFGFPLWDVSPSSAKPHKSPKLAPSAPKATAVASSKADAPALKTPTTPTAPRSPLAGPPLTAPSSPPPPAQTLSKRISFGMLRKRKSETTLSSSSEAIQPSAAARKSVRRSVSTPKLGSSAKQNSPALPSTPSMFKVPASPSANSVTSSPKPNKKRFSVLLPQVFGAKEDVPPVPLLAIPKSAPATTTVFSEVAHSQGRDLAYTSPSPSLLTPALDVEARSGSTPPSPAASDAPRTPLSVASENYFNFVPRHHQLDEEEVELLSSERRASNESATADCADVPTAVPSPTISDFVATADEPPSPTTSEAGRMSLKAFIEASAAAGSDQVMRTKPSRSSSYFATDLAKPVFPPTAGSVSNRVLGDCTNVVQTHATSSSSAKKLGGHGVGHESDRANAASPGSDDGPYGVHEVIVFPVSTPALDSHAWRDEVVSTSESSDDDGGVVDHGSDTGDIEEDGDAQDEVEELASRTSSEDDKPLGVIPGALTAQKSLRQATRKSKSKRGKKDPFEFDALVGGARRGDGTVTPTVGHSLLPQTDDAVERRSASLTRSPSAPLDPVVANSALTIDSPEHGRTARPSQSRSTSASTRSRENSPRRPSLGINAGLAQSSNLPAAPRSPSLVPPQPASRSSSMSSHHPTSAPPSRQPSQRRPSAGQSMQRSRSNTAASNAPSTSSHGHASAIRPGVPSATNSPSASPKIPPPLPTVEHRIFVGDHTKKFRVQVSSATTCADVVATAKKQGLLTFGTDAEGGFSLWEICRTLGVERPIREYEFVADVTKSWDHDTNILIVKRSPLWPLLSASLRIHPARAQGAFVQLEVKKGKWSKRWLEIKDGSVMQGKSEKAKDATLLCHLSTFEVFLVASHAVDKLKAPRPFVFALKSKLPRAHFENEADYCNYVSVKTQEELNKWIKALVEARNPLVRKENAVANVKPLNAQPQLFNTPLLASSSSSRDTSPALSRNPSLRPKPAVLAIPTSPLPGSSDVKSPTSAFSPSATVTAMQRPDPRAWAMMSDAERQQWLREAQKEARQEGKSFLDFKGENPTAPPVSGTGSIRR